MSSALTEPSPEALHRVSRAGRPLHLGPTEYRLLEFFMQHPRRVFSREQVLDAVWGRDIHVEPRTVDVHIRRLRAKLGPECDAMIGTVRNVGYKFVRQTRSRGPADSSDAPMGSAAEVDVFDEVTAGLEGEPLR